MPPSFHDVKHYRKILMNFFQSGALFTSSNGELVDIKYLHQACLAIGLAIRDIHCVQFLEPDDQSGEPDFIVNSHLTIMHQKELLDVCDTIVDMVEDASQPSERYIYSSSVLIQIQYLMIIYQCEGYHRCKIQNHN